MVELLSSDSAMMLRAELPVHRNSTAYFSCDANIPIRTSGAWPVLIFSRALGDQIVRLIGDARHVCAARSRRERRRAPRARDLSPRREPPSHQRSIATPPE